MSGMKKKLCVSLDNNMVFDMNLSNYAVATYYALENLDHLSLRRHCISPRTLAFYLTNRVGLSYTFENSIKNGLQELCATGYAKLEEEYKGFYIISLEDSIFGWKQNNFITVDVNDVNKIFFLKGVEPFSLFKYYLSILKCFRKEKIDNEYTVCNETVDRLSSLAEISESSALFYNTVLETEKIIYIRRYSNVLLNKNTNQEIKRMPNIYGRYINKDLVDKYADELLGRMISWGKPNTPLKAVNKKRRYAQIYNQLVKGIDKEKYTTEELQEVYDYVLDENLKYQNLYKQKNDESYLQKIRDVNVFKEYGFTFEN